MINCKWCRYVEEGIPGPGDKVTWHGDVLRVVTVIRRPDEVYFGHTLSRADLEVELLFSIDGLASYEGKTFFVGPIEGYVIRDGWFAFDGYNEEGKPCWLQPASMGRVYEEKEADKLLSTLKEKVPGIYLYAVTS